MNMIYVSLGLAGLGLLLIVISFVWPTMVPTEEIWSAQQAREHAQAGANLHYLQHQRIHKHDHQPGKSHRHAPTDPSHQDHPQDDESDDQPDDGSFQAAQQRYDRSRMELKAAQSYRGRIAGYFRWTGFTCSLVGIVGYCLLRRGDHD